MSVDFTANEVLLGALKMAILAVGGFIWWKMQVRGSAARWRIQRLNTWDISVSNFLFFALAALIGGILGSGISQMAALALYPRASTDHPLLAIIVGTGFQLGVVAGIVAFKQAAPKLISPDPSLEPAASIAELKTDSVPPLPKTHAVWAGLVTYGAAVPTVMLTSWAWQGLLDALHIERPMQDTVMLFGETHDPVKLTLLATVAVLIAPIMEELVFRAGLFRFFRTRIPRALAFLIPAALFGAAHLNLNALVPLLVLAIILSLGYERTGRILTPMIAHALFNLTTIALILLGLDV